MEIIQLALGRAEESAALPEASTRAFWVPWLFGGAAGGPGSSQEGAVSGYFLGAALPRTLAPGTSSIGGLGDGEAVLYLHVSCVPATGH